MEPGDLIWEGRIAGTPLRVGVPHAGRIIAEWDAPEGQRHKISDTIEEFERSVLFQLLLRGGETNESATKEVLAAIMVAQAERPTRVPEAAQRRRKNPKVRQHRRSRRPPRRR